MPLPTQPYKGTRDFYPEDKRLQKYLFNTIRKVVESYGYEEYDAPIIEPLELYLAKSGSELVNEQTYTFEDRGGRKVAIRPEMTPSVSRMVAARRQELVYPLRWYSIPNLWRYERPQRGRLREHWQLNVDIFGDSSLRAEHELILLINRILSSFGAKESDFGIRLNSRQLIRHILNEFLALTDVQAQDLMRLIDHKARIEEGNFNLELKRIIEDNQKYEKLTNILRVSDLKELPAELKNHSSTVELEKLFSLLDKSGVKNVSFDITLMRGLDYYTDIVFEVFDKDPENNRAMFGGGRYNGLVGLFGVEALPTAGFGMGDVTLSDFLKSHSLIPDLTSELDIYAIIIGDVYERSLPLINELRATGINIAIESTEAKIDKKIKNAVKKNVKYVVFIGENEVKNKTFKLKDISTGKEEDLMLKQIIEKFNPNTK